MVLGWVFSLFCDVDEMSVLSTICAISGIQDQVGFPDLVWVPEYCIYSILKTHFLNCWFNLEDCIAEVGQVMNLTMVLPLESEPG